MTKYHNSGLEIPHVCNDTTKIFTSFTNSTDIYCYNLSSLQVDDFISRPVLFCRQYNITSNNGNSKDLLVSLKNTECNGDNCLYVYEIDPS